MKIFEVFSAEEIAEAKKLIANGADVHALASGFVKKGDTLEEKLKLAQFLVFVSATEEPAE